MPSTYYAKDSNHLLGAMKEIGSTVIGLDWRTSLRFAREQYGNAKCLQGNL
ncbi:MAG: hypothetical protein OI718_00145, partial (plasmid) [Candidatus Methanoperedens sp.]